MIYFYYHSRNKYINYLHISTYIIHFKDYDFDLEHWKRLPFSPERYFLSDRDYNLDGTYSQLPWEALKDQKDAIDELAQIGRAHV